MSLIKQRTSVFLYTKDKSPKAYADAIKQDDQKIKLPASKEFPVSRQDKFSINTSCIKPMYTRTFDHIGVFHAQFDNGVLRLTEPAKEYHGTMFPNQEYNVQPGLVMNVAPQSASDMEEYERYSRFFIRLLMIFFNVDEVDESHSFNHPIYYKEWFRRSIYNKDMDPSTMVLHFWKHLFKEEYELPMDDLTGLSGFEIIFDQRNSADLNLILYFKEVTTPIVFDKNGWQSPEKKGLLNEVGVFVKSSSLDEEVNYVYSGYIFELNELTKAEEKVVMKQAMIQDIPNVREMFYHNIQHSIVEPYGIHPIYKVQFDTVDTLKDVLELKPALYYDSQTNAKDDISCLLKMTMDLPKTVFIDKYQLESSREYKEMFPKLEVFQEPDLELPSYKVDRFGSSIVMELNHTKIVSNDYSFELPLHLRYGEPENGGYKEMVIPRGNVYWECQYNKPILENGSDADIESEMQKMNVIDKYDSLNKQIKDSLFYETRLNEQSLTKDDEDVLFLFTFSENYSKGDTSKSKYLDLKVPVGNVSNDGKTVEMFTLLCIICGTLWITRKIFFGGDSEPKVPKIEKKKNIEELDEHKDGKEHIGDATTTEKKQKGITNGIKKVKS